MTKLMDMVTAHRSAVSLCNYVHDVGLCSAVECKDCEVYQKILGTFQRKKENKK